MDTLKNLATNVVSYVTERVVNFNLPFETQQLVDMRMNLLKEMKAKRFSHYYDEMKRRVDLINQVSLNDDLILKDDLWGNADEEPFWMKDSEYLKAAYTDKYMKRLFLFQPVAGVTSATSALLKDSFVSQLIGDPFWMTIQQKVLFRTLIGTYFSNDLKLWPINLNMDLVYRRSVSELENARSRSRSRSRQKVLTPEEIEAKVKAWMPPVVDGTLGPQQLTADEVEIMRQKYKAQLLDFNRLSQEEKKEASTLERVLTAALAGSGPFILKILQQINTANDNVIDGKLSVAELTKDLFSNIPGLTPEESQFVKSTFQETVQEDTSKFADLRRQLINNMNPQTLGSASIAEAHLTHSDQLDGVIKFIKPMYAFYYLCEMDFLLVGAWAAIAQQVRKTSGVNTEERRNLLIIQCRKLLMFFVKQFADEFNYMQEWKNTTVGYEVYNKPDGNVRSIVALGVKQDPFPYIILQKVEGMTVDKLLKNGKVPYSDIYSLVYELIGLWFTNTLWGDGFFHADLHPGNVIIQPDGKTITPIDYGSCGQISRKERCQLIKAMYLSGQFHQLTSDQLKTEQGQKLHQKNLKLAQEFVMQIWTICSVNSMYISKKHLREVAERILRYDSGIFFSTMFLDIVEFSDDIGMCISNDILMFGRAVAYLSSMITSVIGKCRDSTKCPPYTIDGIIRGNLLRNPIQLVKLLRGTLTCEE